MINSRVISLWNLLAFSLTTNPHLHLTFREFDQNPCRSFLLALVKQKPLYLTWLFTWTFFSSTCKVESIEHFFEILSNCNFSEGRISVMSSHDQARDFFCSRWASPPINLVESLALGLPFTILKASNPIGQPVCSEEDLATFKSSHPASSLAQSFAPCSSCQNLLFDSKDKHAGGTSIEGSNRRTPAPAATRAPTPAVVLVVAPLIASTSADSCVVRYLKIWPQADCPDHPCGQTSSFSGSCICFGSRPHFCSIL